MAQRGGVWKVFEETTSTNDTIHQAAAAGSPEGTLHIALRQTRGRGRLGRSWWSAPGAGLTMSLLLRPRLSPERVAGIALLAGLAAKEGLQPLASQPISLYWPNDLYVGPRRKLGGILCELRGQPPDHWVALGLGINLRLAGVDIPRDLLGRIACLAEIGCREDRPLVLARRIVERFWPHYDRLQDGAAVGDIVGGELAQVGAAVTVSAAAATPLQGTVVGLGAEGELLVRDGAGQVHRIVGGEVIYGAS